MTRSIASGRVMGHRQIPVIEQLSAIIIWRGDRHPDSSH
jgi:hypothetical protein